MDAFLGMPIGNITQYGLVGVCVIAVLAGWLIPRWVMTELRKDRDAWKAAWEKSEDTKRVIADDLSKMLHEYGPTTNHALSSIPRAGGEGNVVQENTAPTSP